MLGEVEQVQQVGLVLVGRHVDRQRLVGQVRLVVVWALRLGDHQTQQEHVSFQSQDAAFVHFQAVEDEVDVDEGHGFGQLADADHAGLQPEVALPVVLLSLQHSEALEIRVY